MKAEIRRLIAPLFNEEGLFTDVMAYEECPMCGFPFNKEYRSKCIDQATEQIIKLIEDMLPEEKERDGIMISPVEQGIYIDAYNQCLSEIKAKLEE